MCMQVYVSMCMGTSLQEAEEGTELPWSWPHVGAGNWTRVSHKSSQYVSPPIVSSIPVVCALYNKQVL